MTKIPRSAWGNQTVGETPNIDCKLRPIPLNFPDNQYLGVPLQRVQG